MQRKKGVYDLVYYKTRNNPEPVVTGVDWKMIQQFILKDYKDFITVKDEDHTSEPFFKVITNDFKNVKDQNREEYFYTKRK